MAKKRRKKNGGAGFFGIISSVAGIVLGSLWRSAPYAVSFFIFGVLFFNFKEMLYADGALSVQKIEVTPAQSLSIEELSHIEERVIDKNILKVDLEKLSRELETKPQIRSARVNRHFPNRRRTPIRSCRP